MHSLKIFAIILMTIVTINIMFVISDYSRSISKTLEAKDNKIKELQLEVDLSNNLIKDYVKEIEKLNDEINKLKERKTETVKAKVTAYSPLDNKSGICADGNPTRTSTGKFPSRGIIAVDPSKIPYGTEVYIPGYGNAIAEDTGGAIRRYDGIAIDVVVDTYEEAIKWGVKYIDVIIKK